MPVVTVTMKKPKTAAFKKKVLDAVHAALAKSGASPKDRFHRVIELPDDDFQYDPVFPDLSEPRSDDFLLVEILLGVGRSVSVKRAILSDAVDRLAACGINPEHVMVVFQDVAWENFSPGGGRVPQA